MEDDGPGRVYIFPLELLTYTNAPASSLSLPRSLRARMNIKWLQIFRQHARTGTSRDDCHYSASSKYSNSIRGDTKGLIRADELPSRVPFFLLLLIAAISGRVGAMVPDNYLLFNEPVFHVYAHRDDVARTCHCTTPHGVHAQKAEC